MHVDGSSGETARVIVTDAASQKTVYEGSAAVSSDGIVGMDFQIQDVNLWYPHGYGAQPLYDFTATVSAGKLDLDTSKRRIGFRKAELIQEPDEIGKSFYFRVNDVDIFCGGSDWIPADNFVPRITEDKYRRWLQMMVDGYQVMIR